MPLSEVISSRFQVEVSGWDRGEDFFVENSHAIWHGPGEKTVYVRRPLREGTILFVRLQDWGTNRQSYPVAYRAKKIGIVDADGLRPVLLEPVNSRTMTPAACKVSV